RETFRHRRQPVDPPQGAKQAHHRGPFTHLPRNSIMTPQADATARSASSSEDDDDDSTPADDFDELEADASDDLSDETGIDLTDASELDADNVPADEEFDRVMNAPD
ncbi:MAG TPA: hypothetical protein VM845_00250, partial [Burkholderiaceae bacterium]|nr:hypothetical protein [Burkholderiaceae bacterium]